MLYLLPVYREGEGGREAFVGLSVSALSHRAASPAYGGLDFGPSRRPPPSSGRRTAGFQSHTRRAAEGLLGHFAPLLRLPRICTPTEVLCLRPPDFPFPPRGEKSSLGGAKHLSPLQPGQWGSGVVPRLASEVPGVV